MELRYDSKVVSQANKSNGGEMQCPECQGAQEESKIIEKIIIRVYPYN